MKAIVQDRYGSVDVFQLREMDVPVPNDDEVLVRVRATSLHPDVWHAMRGVPYILRLMGSGRRRPKNPVPGTDVAGVVESVGRNVTRFHQGDEVFGPTVGANLWGNGGSYAEYAAVSEYEAAWEAGRAHVRTGRQRAHLRTHRGPRRPR
jgi:NADPH:quinone reductase-like Zn-dependent oxidoreductase